MGPEVDRRRECQTTFGWCAISQRSTLTVLRTREGASGWVWQFVSCVTLMWTLPLPRRRPQGQTCTPKLPIARWSTQVDGHQLQSWGQSSSESTQDSSKGSPNTSSTNPKINPSCGKKPGQKLWNQRTLWEKQFPGVNYLSQASDQTYPEPLEANSDQQSLHEQQGRIWRVV